MEKKKSEFNIRVYGLVINTKNEVLLTDEFRLGIHMTKFPGGGLKKGEGTIDCLKREFLEEMNQEITNIRHYYTTDFFQPGWFYENMQLISIYYLADLKPPLTFRTSETLFDFDEKNGNQVQSFRWVPICKLTPEKLTFPIDKKVINMLKNDKRFF